MIGLLEKDLYLIVKNFSFAYLIILIAPVFAAFSNPQDAMFIFCLMIALLFAFQITNTMSLDETAHWKKNVTAMPVTYLCEAASKYILAVLLAILAGIGIGMIGLLWQLLYSISFTSIIMYIGIGCSVVLLYACIIIPISYRFGTTKSRYIFMLFVFIPAGTPLVLKALHININFNFLKNINQFKLACWLALCLALCVFISLFISVSILKYRQDN